MQLRDKLLAGEIDLLFCTKIDDPRVEGALIGEHQIVLLVPESHRLAQRESVDLRELDGEPFISFDNNCQLRSVTDELFRSLGIQPKITMETAQDLSLIHIFPNTSTSSTCATAPPGPTETPSWTTSRTS